MNTLLKILSLYFNSLTRVSPQLSAKHAFNLFAYPFSAKLKPKQQAFLETSELFTVKVNSKIVQCYSWGQGKETILFVHGWQSHSYRWKSYIEAIDKNRFTLLAFDAPGHGNSKGKTCTVPHFEKSIQAITRKKGKIDHLIGHSIGSFACASFMNHNNYPVKSYVSLASPYHALEFVQDFKSKVQLSDSSLKALSDYFKSYTSHPIEHYSLEVFTKNMRPNKTLIIHDKEDKSTSYQNAEKTYSHLIQNNQNVELVLTEGFKHNLRSQEIVNLVMKHLES